MIVTIIPKEYLSNVWPEASGYIEAAWDRAPGYYSAKDILDRIIKDLEVLWGVYDEERNMIGCFTTAIEEYPQARIMVITALSGKDLEAWYEKALDIVKKYSVDQGCSRLEARGRGGWTAYAKKTGWETVGMTYKIDLQSED